MRMIFTDLITAYDDTKTILNYAREPFRSLRIPIVLYLKIKPV